MDVVDDDISCCLLVLSDGDEDVRIPSLPTAERASSLAALRELWMGIVLTSTRFLLMSSRAARECQKVLLPPGSWGSFI